MRQDIDGLENVYDLCVSRGFVKEKAVDIELIKSLKGVAENGLAFIDRAAKDIPKGSVEWTFVFRDHYESLRGLIEAYLLFEGIEADQHQCKNAVLCFRHPELELDWEFLETVRLKRNAINYRGQSLDYEGWKAFKLRFDVHIAALRHAIEQRLAGQD